MYLKIFVSFDLRRIIEGLMHIDMGIFDIFKKGDKGKPVVPEADKKEQTIDLYETARQQGFEQEKPVDDINNTELVATLLNIPREQRDENWVERFLKALPKATFHSASPQLIAGPDGFPYFQLFVSQPGDDLQPYVIEEMIHGFLVERGYGIVINPGTAQPDWVLTYGDILNYSLTGNFFTIDSLFSNHNKVDEAVKAGEEIMVGQPSESILPQQTRKLLKDFFELNSIQNPKVMLMVRKTDDEVQQDLVFNITPSLFDSEDQYRNMMQTVTWYLPRHYSIMGLAEENIENGFMPL